MKETKNRFLLILLIVGMALLCMFPFLEDPDGPTQVRTDKRVEADPGGDTTHVFSLADSNITTASVNGTIYSDGSPVSTFTAERGVFGRFAGSAADIKVKKNDEITGTLDLDSGKMELIWSGDPPKAPYVILEYRSGEREARMKRGIDLAGGTILVYKIEEDSQSEGFDTDQLVAALSRRINPDGNRDVTIRPLGDDRVEIILPAAEPQDVQAVQDKITALGQLEFRILANPRVDRGDIDRAIAMFKRRDGENAPKGYKWVQTDDGFDIRDSAVVDSAGNTVTALSSSEGNHYALTKEPLQSMHVTGEFLESSTSSLQDFNHVVAFTLNTRGAYRFGRLTKEYGPKEDGTQFRLAILLDNRITSAPSIDEPIEGGRGIIRGNFTQEEVDNYVAILNAGKLPAVLEKVPASKDTITSTLGEDTIKKGQYAIIVAMIAVPVFMFIYYFLAGLVADLALLLNIILILGFMGFSKSTFTLPGLAGLALTIGMAVDANVLIFERIREELTRGVSITSAVRNGFDRAWFAIFDSNITSILTGLVLWFIGTDQVKGFALTLIIGLLANLFTAVFVGRTVFEFLIKRRIVQKLPMLHLIRPPKIDYVGKQKILMSASAVLITVGLAAVVTRGGDLLDIDFTGGTLISVRLKQGSDSAEIRKRATDAGLPNVKVERLILETETKEDAGRLFLVRTTEKDQSKVRAAIIGQFSSELALLELKAGKRTELPAIDENDQAQIQVQLTSYLRGTPNKEPMSAEVISLKITKYLNEQNVDQPELVYSLSGETKIEGEKATTFNLLTSYEDVDGLIAAVNADFASEPVFERENNFQSQVAGETRNKAFWAILGSWVVIIFYLAFRFKDFSYGLAAVVALVHDVLVTLGFIAASAWIASVPGLANALGVEAFKIDLTVVAAFLAIIGFSVNDTIVIFDRVREIKGKAPVVTADMINQSINQCMGRTILTTLTTFMVLFILYYFGGPGIHTFSFAVLIGALTGTYSTIFIASPVLLTFAKRAQLANEKKNLRYQKATANA